MYLSIVQPRDGHLWIMRSSLLIRSCVLSLLGLFLYASVEVAASNPNSSASAMIAMAAGDSARPQRFACLPTDTRLDDVVTYDRKGNPSVTVKDQLTRMKARCRSGKLVNSRRREIRFFHQSCWGNPPPDYLEIRERENQELAKLKKRSIVIVFACNPMMQ